jgi:uncharacterized protein (UPF0332 family)/predicted nucleotidyltransferase
MADRRQLAIDFAKSLDHLEIEKIILFGSVARGEDTEESDIDMFILANDENKIKNDVSDISYDLLLKTGEYISPKIVHIEHYKKYKDFSFYKNVNKDGIILAKNNTHEVADNNVNNDEFVLDEIAITFKKAIDTLEVAELMFNQDSYDFSMNRSYYAAFYGTKALLLKKGITYVKPSKNTEKFIQEYVKNDKFNGKIAKTLAKLEEDKMLADYDYTFKATKTQAKEDLKKAKEFIEECKKFL